MALEHALLVALSEQPASGFDLARRFGRSIGFFGRRPTSRSTACSVGWTAMAG